MHLRSMNPKVFATVRLLCAVSLGAIASALSGCYAADSARADYYTSRAVQAQGRDGDGSIVIVSDRSDELREALLRAKRIQLAGADAEK
jgi:hypothetical protein